MPKIDTAEIEPDPTISQRAFVVLLFLTSSTGIPIIEKLKQQFTACTLFAKNISCNLKLPILKTNKSQCKKTINIK